MPNTTIRAVREAMRLSQEEFAEKIREAGTALGEPNECTARTVQRWEGGAVSYPRRNMIRAIERATGYAAEELGFDHVPRVGKLSDHTDGPVEASTPNLAPLIQPAVVKLAVVPTLTGIWESRCTYESSSRQKTFVDRSNLIIVHAGNELTARSIDGSVTEGGSILMRLELRGRVVTGIWEQNTGPDSHYQGAQFHGAVQLQVDGTNSHMRGAWTGFGRDFEVNTGPWELIRREIRTGKAADYAAVPE